MRGKLSIKMERDLAERKAWDALSRYKFAMFGYWCGIWVHLNRIIGDKQPNPFKKLVVVARDHAKGRNVLGVTRVIPAEQIREWEDEIEAPLPEEFNPEITERFL
jgi:hypothetical protein